MGTFFRLTWPRRAPLCAITPALLLLGCGRADDRVNQSPAADSGGVERPAVLPVLPVQLEALTARPGASVGRIDVRRDTTTFGTGPAVVTLSTGDTLVVGDSAVHVWKFGSGSLVAFSGLDGAGGYENEGQSLTVVDVATGARRRVVSDYYAIVRVELLESAGRRTLLVHMRDGGQGSLHVTVVDPKRGQVFRARQAVARISDGRIIVSTYDGGEKPVDFGETRLALRVDTIALAAVDTMSLLVVPRAP